MIDALNAPVPAWLSLGEPIRAEVIARDVQRGDEISFRPRSGGATNSATRVQIPDQSIDVELDHRIDYFGKNEEGQGVSLSPDGKKLLVNLGTETWLYEVADSGRLHEVLIDIPHVTYDDGLKGLIFQWSWASDGVMVANAEVMDEKGHNVIENRVYAFHQERKSLSRLDFSALNLDANDPPSLKVLGFRANLDEIVLEIDGKRVLAKADLKSLPRLLEEPRDRRSASGKVEGAKNSRPMPSELKEHQSASEKPGSLLWFIAGVILVAILAFFLKTWEGKVFS